MAKFDTIREIETANGQAAPENLTQKQLDELRTIASRDGAGNLDAFNTKLTEFQGAEKPAAPAPREKTATVRVNDVIAAYGGEFTDPDTHAVIGKEPVTVKLSAFVREKLRSEELVEE